MADQTKQEMDTELTNELMTSESFWDFVSGRYDDDTLDLMADVASGDVDMTFEQKQELVRIGYDWQAKRMYDVLHNEMWEEIVSAAEDYGYDNAVDYLFRDGVESGQIDGHYRLVRHVVTEAILAMASVVAEQGVG